MSVNLLSRIPLFADLPASELDKLLNLLGTNEMQDREMLFEEGDPGEHFYVVMKGELEVLTSAGHPDEFLLNILREGEYLGEMGLIMPGGHRTAGVRARGNVTLLSMSRSQFVELTRAYPELSTAMLR